jgi:hypothetical protein
MSVELLAVVKCNQYDCEESAQTTATVELSNQGLEVKPDLPEGWEVDHSCGYGTHREWHYYCPEHNTREKRGY